MSSNTLNANLAVETFLYSKLNNTSTTNDKNKLKADLTRLYTNHKSVFNTLNRSLLYNKRFTVKQVRNMIITIKKKELNLTMPKNNVSDENMEVEMFLYSKLNTNTSNNIKNQLRRDLINLHAQNNPVYRKLKNQIGNKKLNSDNIRKMIDTLKEVDKMNNNEVNDAFNQILKSELKGGKPRKNYTGPRGGKYYYKKVKNKMVKKYI
jgi:hypothetical protein